MKALAFSLLLVSTPALAIDRCMVGVWKADASDMAQVMATQMGGSAQHLSGSAVLEITETGVMTLLSDDLKFSISMPDMPAMELTISGFAEGAMNADDGRNYVANAPVYDLLGTADVLGQTMSIPVTSAAGTGWGVSQGTYGCRGLSMSFEATVLGSIPRRFEKLR
jgi:hypothetical protein